jgi:hypothetical protein
VTYANVGDSQHAFTHNWGRKMAVGLFCKKARRAAAGGQRTRAINLLKSTMFWQLIAASDGKFR